MTFTSGIALALAAVLSGNSASVQAVAAPMPQAQSVQQYVENYFAGEPVLAKIAYCESTDRQYDADGSVFSHLNTNGSTDIGVMQINELYQGATAKKLGLDLYTMQGNVAYAQYLYQKEGTTPWDSSKACWGKSQNTTSGPTVATAIK